MRAIRERLVGLAVVLAGIAALGGSAEAGSACTTVYGTRVSGTTYSVVYYDPYASTYNTLTPATTTRPNAAALDPVSGKMYFVDQGTNNLYTYDPVARTVSASLGTLPVPAPANTSPALASTTTSPAIIGATFAAGGSLYVLYSSTNGGKTVIGQISPANGALIGKYNELLSGGAAVVSPLTNGDIATNGVNDFIVAEPNKVPTLYTLNAATGTLTNPVPLKLNGATFTSTAATVNGMAYNPVTGQYYVNLSSAGTPANNGLFTLDPTTGTLSDPNNGTTYTGITDLASCGVLPDKPTVSKSFAAVSAVGAPATTTLTLTIGNTNTAPYYLVGALTDALPSSPAQMVIASPPALSGSCLAASGATQGNAALVTATAGSAQVVLAGGLTVPVGGCTVSVAVTAPALGLYTNTIAAGGLKTTAGNSALSTSATFNVQTTALLSVVKSHSPATLAAGGQGTYTLTVSNVTPAGGVTRLASSGTITVTDTLPASLGVVPATGFQMTSGGLTWTCSYDDELVSGYKTSGQTVICTTPGTLNAGGSSAINFAVTVLPDATGSISNTAAVGGGGDPFNGGAVPGGAACDALHCSTDTAPVTALPIPPTVCANGNAPTNLLATPNTAGFSNRDSGSDSTPISLIAGAANYRQGVGGGDAYVIDLDWWFNNGVPAPSHASTLSLYVGGTEYARSTSNEGLSGAASLVGLNGASVSAGWMNRGYYQGAYPKLRAFVTLPASVTAIGGVSMLFTASAAGGTSDDSGFNLRAINACTKPFARLAAVKTVQNITAGSAAGSSSSGKPGEVLEYCIATQNTGTVNATRLVFSDSVPGNTGAQSGAYGAGQDIKIVLPSGTGYATFAADSDAGQLGGGAISVNLSALVLMPGQGFTICFRATIG